MDKWLSHPTALKIISVVLALLLWAVVHIDTEKTPQTITSSVDTKTIEAAVIKTEGLNSEKYILTAMEPTVVRLDVQGRLTSLMNASSDDDYIVKVDLKNAKAGIQELPLTYSLPKGIQLVQMSPRTVKVQLQEIMTKSFEMQVVAEGTPAAGFIAGTPTVVAPTNEVKVTLPKEDMSRVGLVSVEINVEGADKTVVNKKAKVMVYDTDGIEMTHAKVSPETVHVEAKVTLPFKTLPLQVSYTGSLPEGLSLVSMKPVVDKVTVFGDQKTLDALLVYDGVVLDLSKVKQSGSVMVKTQLIDGIKSVDPAELSINVVVAPNITRTMTGLPVTINGVADGLSAVIRTPADGKFNLTVSGAETVLSALKNDEISLIANVEGLAPGTHVVTLQVDVPSYVQIVNEGQLLTITIDIIDDQAAMTDPVEPDDGHGSETTQPPTATPDPGGGGGGGNATGGTNTNT
ncbi:YbbR domain-containing protein [Paenibacillus castaneae]|uniref:CdaR family protein n=1 Tax=Paenibacillus castaneae TaxID=474957 RepID=UPI00141B6438|nr:CdaR family protein [Paenibacillus castaneae]NIK79056.1 YbbR domain-containing protein [Paenibacillus castaneae]